MIALAILALLQVADATTTVRILNQGGRELNPLLARLFVRFGPVPTLIVAKLGLVGLLAWVATPWITWGACAIYVVVVANNVRVMRTQAKESA